MSRRVGHCDHQIHSSHLGGEGVQIGQLVNSCVVKDLRADIGGECGPLYQGVTVLQVNQLEYLR